ncbi:MAG TPA: hypothetical protein VF442_12355, partial [Sphingobium sp.]
IGDRAAEPNIADGRYNSANIDAACQQIGFSGRIAYSRCSSDEHYRDQARKFPAHYIFTSVLVPDLGINCGCKN